MSQPTVAGYRKRPLAVTLLAIGFALVPIFSWISWYTPYLLAGRPETIVDVVLANFATAAYGPWGLFHAVLMAGLWVLFWTVSWGIWKVTNWGFYLCIVSAVANSLFSMIQYGVSKSDGLIEEIVQLNVLNIGVLVNLVFFIPVLLILNKDIMAPFFNPKMKWWEQHPRVKAMLKIEAEIGGKTESFQSFDISASGMFLSMGDLSQRPVGDSYFDKFPAHIYLEDLGTVVQVICTVVWVSDGKGRAPAGCGVTFEYPRRSDRKQLGLYLKTMIEAGHVIERT
jgi:hypothetical protein